jgi:two-component system sensor histidine kinase DegS
VSGEDHAEDRGRRLQQLERSLALCERERALIAYELHDGLVQHLAAALMHVDGAVAQIKSDPSEALAMLRMAADRLRDSLQEMRRLMRGIRPPRLESEGLSAAITELVEELVSRGMEISLTLDISTPRLLPTLETAAYRIAQESLNNVLRHSGAKHAEVAVREVQGFLEVIVNDQGCGFIPADVPFSRYGLRGIRERAELLGGTADITSQVGSGTTVFARLPLSDPLLK